MLGEVGDGEEWGWRQLSGVPWGVGRQGSAGSLRDQVAVVRLYSSRTQSSFEHCPGEFQERETIPFH